MRVRHCLCSSIISGDDDARLRKLRACMGVQFRQNVIFVVKALIRIHMCADATQALVGECAIDQRAIDTETRYCRVI